MMMLRNSVHQVYFPLEILDGPQLVDIEGVVVRNRHGKAIR